VRTGSGVIEGEEKGIGNMGGVMGDIGIKGEWNGLGLRAAWGKGWKNMPWVRSKAK